MKRFLPYYKYLLEVKWYFLLAVLAGVVFGVATGWGLPRILEKAVPEMLKGSEVPLWEVVKVASLIPLVFGVRGVSQYVNGYLVNYCGFRVLERIQVRVFSRLQILPLSFFQRNKSGDLLSRLMGDTQMMRTVIVDIANQLIMQPMVLMGALIYLAVKSYEQSEFFILLVCLGTIPLCVFPIRILGKKLLKKAKKLQAESGELTASVTDSLQAPQEIRAYNMQDSMEGKFRANLIELFRSRMKVVKYDKLMSPSIEIVTSFGMAITIVYAGKQGMDFKTDLFPLMTALFLCYDPVKKLGAIHGKIQKGLASLNRIEYILNHEDNLPEAERPIPFDDIQADVTFENVDFAYNETTVLKGIDVSVPAGQVVALVGRSGAGKSTFSSLILRFYDVLNGKVCVDGKDVRAISKHSLRDKIAIVAQSPVIFNESVMENIRIGRPDASDAEVISAAKKAHADDFINNLEGGQGYQTPVGEKGGSLSGGQRQRIAIARAFLKDAPILILDEATSALDSESEAKIQDALEQLVKGRTTFIIAHRFSTIKIADRILVFDRGEIVADGAHEDIYPKSELYRDLYDRQSG